MVRSEDARRNVIGPPVRGPTRIVPSVSVTS